jgi:hypothetical protein
MPSWRASCSRREVLGAQAGDLGAGGLEPLAEHIARFCTALVIMLDEPEAAGTGQLPMRCVYPLLTRLPWLFVTHASFSAGLWRRQLSGRCPAQHAVDHYIDGEAKPFVGIAGDQLSGVGGNEREVAGR